MNSPDLRYMEFIIIWVVHIGSFIFHISQDISITPEISAWCLIQSPADLNSQFISINTYEIVLSLKQVGSSILESYSLRYCKATHQMMDIYIVGS